MIKLYKMMRRAPLPLRASRFMPKGQQVVTSGPKSRKPVIVPLVIMQYGNIVAKLRTFKYMKKYLKGSLFGMRESAKNITLNPNTGKNTMNKETLEELETFCYDLGVTSIGYTKVNPNYIFHKFEILTENAIVISMKMDRNLLAKTGHIDMSKEVFRTYYELGEAVNRLADWLRERGYDCHASPALGGDINTVPTAVDAGMGCIGKHGLVITPEEGPCVRLAAVFVNIENLPFSKKNNHLWIKDYCDTCNRCVKACPGNAIYENTPEFQPGEPYYIDREKCAVPFSAGCSMCIVSCPFTSGHYDKIKEAYDKRKSQSV